MTSLEIEQRRKHVLANPIKEKSNNLRIYLDVLLYGLHVT